MRSLAAFLLACLPVALHSQITAPPPVPAPQTVVATIDGQKLTYGELQSYLDGLPPEQRQAAMNDRRQLVQQYALMKRLLGMAAEKKLENESPYKEALETARMQVLTNAAINKQYVDTLVTQDDQKKFYDSNRDRYTQVKLQVLYLGFVADPSAKPEAGKKYRSATEAKQQISNIREQIHSAADFKRLVKQESEDDTSKARDGEYGVVTKADNLPPAIKDVVFALKEGEVSPPILQRNGYYLFRADSVGLKDFATVKDEIYNELKDVRMKQWIENTQKSIPIQYDNEAFFGKKK